MNTKQELIEKLATMKQPECGNCKRQKECSETSFWNWFCLGEIDELIKGLSSLGLGVPGEIIKPSPFIFNNDPYEIDFINGYNKGFSEGQMSGVAQSEILNPQRFIPLSKLPEK